jgi:hypothetical protein
MPLFRRQRSPAGLAMDGSIGLRVARLDDLFCPLDPAHANERPLSDHIEAYLVGKEKRRADRGPCRIILHAPVADQATAFAAIPRHFATRACEIERDMHETIRRGWHYLALGMTLLTVCMVLGYFARTWLLPEPYGTFVEQALSVFGWVANWRPAEILLYERLNARRRIAAYQRLAGADVTLQPG